jgi:hypothetical protein
MFGRDLMVRADNRPLKKRPDAFYRVGMDIASYPFLGTMVDSLMPSIVVGNPIASWPIIGVDSLSIRSSVLSDKLVKCLTPNSSLVTLSPLSPSP